jgi:hypothetical protein
MKKLVSLLLCLLLGLFAVVRATKPAHGPTVGVKTAHEKPTAQKAGAELLLDEADKMWAEENTDEEVTSDEDGEDINDDDNGDAGDEDTSDDDGGDDHSGDNGGGDDGD